MKTIGILGAGQLGKMLAEAATKLGFKTYVYAPDSDPIAASVATRFSQKEYHDLHALRNFATIVDVITLEFENVPVEPLQKISTHIRPSPAVLEVTQHRIREKTLARDLGIGTAPFAAVRNEQDLKDAIATIGTPGILKTCTLGYDGKGQWKIVDGGQWTEDKTLPFLSTAHCPPSTEYIYEGFVDFEKEISVIVARSASGEVQCFEPVENVHKNHILHTTTAPADITDAVSAKAMQVAIKLATALEVVGLLAVEMFVTKEGDVLVNEMAPRPHNSGHWTLHGCTVSQFEQAIRAVTGLPLVNPKRTAPKVVMTNLIGDDEVPREDANTHVVIYGKKEVRPGRKMGHITKLFH